MGWLELKLITNIIKINKQNLAPAMYYERNENECQRKSDNSSKQFTINLKIEEKLKYQFKIIDD